MDWYYVQDGKQAGPVQDGELTTLVQAGRIARETLVWHAGLQDWQPYGAVAGAVAGAAVSSAADAAPAAGGGTACSQCGRLFAESQLIAYEQYRICPACKPVFFQQLQEGGGGGEGNTPNAELMSQARACLKGRWGIAVGTSLLSIIISIAAQSVPLIGPIAGLLITGPLTVGMAIFYLTLVRGGEPKVSMIFAGFRQFGTSLGAYLLMCLFIGLWFLAFSVPGMIVMAVMMVQVVKSTMNMGDMQVPAAALASATGGMMFLFFFAAIVAATIVSYRYMMTFYIIADDAAVGPLTVIRTSKQMMYGKKWKFFCLFLRFIGWSLLCVLTLGIGFLWLLPYMSASMVLFYEDVRGRAAA